MYIVFVMTFWRADHGNGSLNRPGYLAQLTGKELGKLLLLPENLLKADEEIRWMMYP